MKQHIIGAMMVLAFSSQAQAKFYPKDTLSLNIGVAESDQDLKENIYGITIFQANGKGKFGWAGGVDYLKYSGNIHIHENNVGDVKTDEYILTPNLGMSYGITNEFYVVPTVGFSAAASEATYTYQDGEEEVTENINESSYGLNVGLDLMYKAKNGLVLGFGGRYSSVDGQKITQYQAKIGFSFK